MSNKDFIDKAVEFFQNMEAEPPFVICEEQRQQMIRILEEHKTMEFMLCGCCWACEHGKPYKEYFAGAFGKNNNLSICTIGEHGRDVIAKIEQKGCEHWKLKQ